MMAEGNGNNRVQWAFASRGFLASAIPQAKLTIMKSDVSVNIISEKKLNCTSLGSWKNGLIKICLCLLSSLHVWAKPSGKILLQERHIPLKMENSTKTYSQKNKDKQLLKATGFSQSPNNWFQSLLSLELCWGRSSRHPWALTVTFRDNLVDIKILFFSLCIYLYLSSQGHFWTLNTFFFFHHSKFYMNRFHPTSEIFLPMDGDSA